MAWKKHPALVELEALTAALGPCRSTFRRPPPSEPKPDFPSVPPPAPLPFPRLSVAEAVVIVEGAIVMPPWSRDWSTADLRETIVDGLRPEADAQPGAQ